MPLRYFPFLEFLESRVTPTQTLRIVSYNIAVPTSALPRDGIDVVLRAIADETYNGHAQMIPRALTTGR